jgi:hypothetical protein
VGKGRASLRAPMTSSSASAAPFDYARD